MGQHDGLDRTEIDAEGARCCIQTRTPPVPYQGEAMTGHQRC